MNNRKGQHEAKNSNGSGHGFMAKGGLGMGDNDSAQNLISKA